MSDPLGEGAVPPVARPNVLLRRWVWLLLALVGVPSLVFNLLLPTPTSMASEEGRIVVIVSFFTVIAWLGLFIYFLKLYRGTWRTEPRFAIVLAALTLDAFRNAAENLYFGVSYSGWIQIIPQGIMRILWQPQVMIVSRLLGLSTAMVIVWLVTERGFENLKLREQRSLDLEQRNRELQGLQQLSSLVSGTLEMQTVLNRVCREIVEALRFRSALLCMVDEERGIIYGAAGYGVPQSLINEARRSMDSDDILADIVRSGRTEVIAGWDSRFHQDTFDRYGHATAVRVFAPIDDAQGPVGVVEATVAPDSPPPDAHRLQLLHSFLRHTCNAIRNARLHETVLADRERLNSLTGSLEDKNQQLESFVYMVSHDLKAPLVSIQGFLTLLDSECRTEISDDGRFYLGRLRSNTEHLQSLIRQLLELSRAGSVTGRRERLEMNDLIQDVRETFSPILAQNAVEIQVRSPLPAVWGDPTQIRQLFLNLLDNSIKYMGDSPVRRIEVSGSESDSGTEIVISDTGVGIPEEMRERIFQVFQRLPHPGRVAPIVPAGGSSEEIDTAKQTATGSGAVEGSGVGLAIVRKIAEAHGGKVWVQSEGAGRGAAFHVALPQPAEGSPVEIPDLPSEDSGSGKDPGNGEKEDHDQGHGVNDYPDR